MEFYYHTLHNGIRCILKKTVSPVAYTALTINAGSRDESRKEWGIAHFTEHFIFKGTAKRKAHHINCRLENLGGELNAFTTKEETVVHATTLHTDAGKAVELISDIIFNSVFPEKEIDKEKEIVLDEINSYKDSPSECIYDEFEDRIFNGSPLGHNILGSSESIAGFTGNRIKDFTSRCYNTDQMVFSMAACVSEKEFVRLAESNFGSVPANSREFERETCGDFKSFDSFTLRNTHQGHCIIGNRAYGYHEPKRLTLALLTNILGGPAANSILNVVLREKYGLTYSIEASYTPYQDTGISAVYFGTEKENITKCIELVRRETARIARGEITGRKLGMAKKQFTGQFSIGMESTEGYMLAAAKSYLIYNGIDSPREVYDKIEAITVQDIAEVAEEIFTDMSVLIYK